MSLRIYHFRLMKTSTHIFMFPTYFCYWIYLTFKITSTEIQSKTKLNTVGCTPLLKMTSTRETTQAKMMKLDVPHFLR